MKTLLIGLIAIGLFYTGIALAGNPGPYFSSSPASAVNIILDDGVSHLGPLYHVIITSDYGVTECFFSSYRQTGLSPRYIEAISCVPREKVERK